MYFQSTFKAFLWYSSKMNEVRKAGLLYRRNQADPLKNPLQVWRAIALYIISHMKHGYFDGLKKVNIFEKVEPVVWHDEKGVVRGEEQNSLVLPSAFFE